MPGASYGPFIVASNKMIGFCSVWPLPERMHADQLPQFANYIGMMAQMKVSINVCLERLHPQLR